ncbi:MAG: SpoIIE family protein phosphatase [Myxococcota bacterium]
MDASVARGVWVVGSSSDSSLVGSLLQAGAISVPNAAACLTRVAGPAYLEIVVLRERVPELLRELELLKEDPWFSQVPVLVLLASYDDALVAACLRAGAFQCLIEPVSEELCAAALTAARAARLAERPLDFDAHHVDKIELSFRTPAEAESAAQFLANFCPQPARQALGISELLLNAVEHGNLEIGGETKASLLTQGTFHDEIARRLGDPRYAARRVRVSLRRFVDHIEICCQDEGPGFDWRRLSNRCLEDVVAPRGRGIALARKLSFDAVNYFGSGNRVAARVLLDRLVESASTTTLAKTASPARVSADCHTGQEVTESERAHIESEAQRVLDQHPDDQLLHEVALLAGRLLDGSGAYLGLTTADGCLLVSGVNADGTRHDQVFESQQALPELWSRVLSLSAFLIVNEPREVGVLGVLPQSLLIPIRHRAATIGFLHVAESKSAWTYFDALRLEVMAARLAPFLAARISADGAERRRAEAARAQARTLEDQEAARYLLACLLREGCMDAPGIRRLARALEVFNGDIALAARLPNGGLRWMLGDFVGHGLSAAVGGIPLASIFYATARKGVALLEVVVTMNEMLRGVLPPGYFCAAILLELDGESLRFWNGGMPPALIRRADSHVQELHSNDLPLGVVGAEQLQLVVETREVSAGDRVLCYSDGLIETHGSTGALFGVERAAAAYGEVPAERAFDHLTAKLADFRGAADVSDDLSIVEVTVGVADVRDTAHSNPHARDPALAELLTL